MECGFIRSRLKLSDGFLIFIKWIVGVTMGIECVESGAIVRVEGQPKFDSLWQVRVCKEMTPERHQVSISLFDDCFGTIRVKATGCDDLSLEYFA